MAFERVGMIAEVRGFRAYMSQVRQMDGTTRRFAAGLSTVLKRATIAGGLALAGISIAAVKAFGDFDAAMTKSLAIMGDVSEAMRTDMANAAREVAKTTTFSAEQAAESYFFLASAGLDAAQSVAAMPKVAEFAQAGMFDMATATDLLTDAQSALGLVVKDDVAKNMENMVRISDVLVKANTKANATVQQFSTSLTREAGAALKSFNIDIEEGVAVLAAFADQGVKGEIAGTGLSRILRLLEAGARNNTEAFERYNVAVFDAQDNIRNMADIIEDLENAFEGLSDKQRGAALEAMGFQARVQGIILPLIGASDSIREYEAAARDASGITKEIAEKQLQTFNAQVGLLRDNIMDLFIDIGENLVPVLMDLNTVIREEIIPSLRDWAERFGPALADSARGTADALEDLADQVDDLTSSVRDNEKALVGLGIAAVVAFAWLHPVAGGLATVIGMFALFREDVEDLPEPLLKLRRMVDIATIGVLQFSEGLWKAADAMTWWLGIIPGVSLGIHQMVEDIGVEIAEVEADLQAVTDQLIWLRRAAGEGILGPAGLALRRELEQFGAGILGPAGLAMRGEALLGVDFLTLVQRAKENLAALDEEVAAGAGGLDDYSDSAGGAAEATEDLADPVGFLQKAFDLAAESVDRLTSAFRTLIGLPTTESAQEDLEIAKLRLEVFGLEEAALKAKEARERRIANLERKLGLAREQGDDELVKRLDKQIDKVKDSKSAAEKEIEAIEDQIDALARLGTERGLMRDILEAELAVANENLLTDREINSVLEKMIGQMGPISRGFGDLTSEFLQNLGVADPLADAYGRMLMNLRDLRSLVELGPLLLPEVVGPGSEAGGAPAFQMGGVVPGPIGRPIMAMVHGGERVMRVGQSAFEMPINVNIAGLDWLTIRQTVHGVVDEALDRAKSEAELAGAPLSSGIG